VTGAGHVQESEREGETEEQIKDELVGFLVQKAYCKQRLGQNDLAEKEYEEALKLKPSDQEVAAVASNNLFALRGKDTSLFDSAKKARALNLDTAVEEKLTLQQRRVFAINRCLLSLYTNKHKECLAALAKLEKELTGSELPSLVKAALMAREKRLDECSALLQQYATENPKTALRVKLTLAQLQLQQGEKAAAVGTLESISGAYSHAGIVGAMVKLYDLIKDPSGAIKTLDAACAAMEGDKSKEAPALAKRYRMLAADLRMSSQDSGEALKAMLALVQGGDKDAATVARLVTLLCAAKDVEQVEKYVAMLPVIAEAEDVDVQVRFRERFSEGGMKGFLAREEESGKEFGCVHAISRSGCLCIIHLYVCITCMGGTQRVEDTRNDRACVCVCVYACMCVCIHTHAYICTSTCMCM
jgi:thioredoxin-like negative regulator of GroEL